MAPDEGMAGGDADVESGSELSGEETVVGDKSKGGAKKRAASRAGAGGGRGRDSAAANTAAPPPPAPLAGGTGVGRGRGGGVARQRAACPPTHPMGSPAGALAVPHRSSCLADGPPTRGSPVPLPPNPNGVMEGTLSPPRSATPHPLLISGLGSGRLGD